MNTYLRLSPSETGVTAPGGGDCTLTEGRLLSAFDVCFLSALFFLSTFCVSLALSLPALPLVGVV